MKRRKLRLKLPFLKQTQRRGPKRRIRKEVIYAFLVVVAIFLVILIPRTITNNKLKDLGYSKKAVAAIRAQKLVKPILDNGYYSAYLEKAILDQSVNLDYLPLYTVVDKERDLNDSDFLLYNRLTDKGYTQQQLLNLYENLRYFELTPLLVFDYQYDETPYIEDCKKHPDNSQSTFQLDQNYLTAYENTIAVPNPESVDILVNKTYHLDASYTPPEVVDLSKRYASEGRQLAKVASDALINFIQAGEKVGVTFYATSGYRSYANQEELYKRYSTSLGQNTTDTLSAKPGFSEHQTGYAVDIAATHEDDIPEYKDTLAYQWTSTNCSDYGWILRYPQGKEAITGYAFESWHYRYLGTDLAKAVVASKLTYDEFWNLYLKPWDKEENKPKEAVLNNASYQTLFLQ